MNIEINKINIFEKRLFSLKRLLAIFIIILSMVLIGFTTNVNNQLTITITTKNSVSLENNIVGNNFKTDSKAMVTNYNEITMLPGYSVDFKGYIGGIYNDNARKVVVDQNENIYVIGYTYSSDFPMKNAWNATFGGGNTDVYVAKFSQDGNLLWSTFLGGSGEDQGWGIALDANDNVIVTGITGSTNFPILNGYQSGNRGGFYDGFLAMLNTDGNLLWSTYLGGSGNEYTSGVTVNNQNDILVVGYTTSLDFPLKNAWYSSTSAGTYTTFVSKYDLNGVLIANTLIGGSNNDLAYCITSDSNGNIYIAGETNSADYPIINSYQNTFNGSYDGFISEFNTTGQLVFSTYIGGAGSDIVYGIAVHSNIIDVVGQTFSSSNFPIKYAFNSTFGGSNDAFVTQLTNTGQLTFSSFFSGNAGGTAYSVSLDTDGNLFISGMTDSTNFPVQNALQNSNRGYTDAFIAKVSPNGTLLFSTYQGGNYDDRGDCIVLTPHNNIVIFGTFNSDGLGTSNAYYTNNSGSSDGFIIKLLSNNTQPSSTSDPPGQNSGTTTMTVTESGLETTSSSTNESQGVDQQVLSNPIFSGAIGLMILSMLLNTVLLFRKK